MARTGLAAASGCRFCRLLTALLGGAWALGASCAALDVTFVKGLIAIPSESRSIPDCNRAVAYQKGYLEARGVHCHVERTEKILAAYPRPADDACRSVLSPAVLAAGNAANAIPGEASVTFSYRYVGEDDVEKLRRHVVELTGFEPETLFCVPPVKNDPNDPLNQDLLAAMRGRWGASFRDESSTAEERLAKHVDPLARLPKFTPAS